MPSLTTIWKRCLSWEYDTRLHTIEQIALGSQAHIWAVTQPASLTALVTVAVVCHHFLLLKSMRCHLSAGESFSKIRCATRCAFPLTSLHIRKGYLTFKGIQRVS